MSAPARRSTTDKTGQHTRSKQIKWLLKRDGNVCWLCDTDIDMELKYPDPGCATRDHVVPRSRGGSNALRNLRLAHKYCNEARGATVAECHSPYRDDGMDRL